MPFLHTPDQQNLASPGMAGHKFDGGIRKILPMGLEGTHDEHQPIGLERSPRYPLSWLLEEALLWISVLELRVI